MCTLLVFAPAHGRGGHTHWPATSWVRMQWAGSQAQGYGSPPVVLQVGRWVGALGRGEAPHGSPWRRPCD